MILGHADPLTEQLLLVFIAFGQLGRGHYRHPPLDVLDGHVCLFAEQVKPEIPAAEVDTKQVAENTTVDPDAQVAEIDNDVQIASDQNQDTEVNQNYEAQLQTTTWNELAQEENDVRVVGFKELEVGNGRSINMQELDVNGQRVAVIDVDKDGEPDLALTDLNHNNEMEEGEVIDLHTGEAISFTNDEQTIDNTPDFDTFTI